MKAIEQYFPVVLFIMLYKTILRFESVDKILQYNHSNESYDIKVVISSFSLKRFKQKLNLTLVDKY